MRWAILLLALTVGCDKSTGKNQAKPAAAKPSNDPAALASYHAMSPSKEKLARAKDLDRPESERAALLRTYLEDRKFDLPPEEASATVVDLCESAPGRDAVRTHLIPYIKARATEKQTDDALWQHEGPWQGLLNQAEKLSNPPPG